MKKIQNHCPSLILRTYRVAILTGFFRITCGDGEGFEGGGWQGVGKSTFGNSIEVNDSVWVTQNLLMWLWPVRMVISWKPTRWSWMAPDHKQPSAPIGLGWRISSCTQNMSPKGSSSSIWCAVCIIIHCDAVYDVSAFCSVCYVCSVCCICTVVSFCCVHACCVQCSVCMYSV